MNRSNLISLVRRLLITAGLLLAGAAQLGALAQDIDPPGRVARLNLLQGTVGQLPAGDNDWSQAEINRPLTTGDRLRAEPGARLELHSGSTAARLEGPSMLDISQLDDNTTRLTLSEGQLNLRVRNLYPGEQIEIDTPNLALTVQQPGSYSLEVDPRSATTRVATRYGSATVYGENAEAMPLPANGQQFTFAARNLAQAAPPSAWRNDDFDLWADARDRAEDQSISARYVSRDIPGYQQLDAFGDWQNDTTYGAVWIPRVTVAGWAPYRYGQWRWIPPWGWTWVDDAPWGFAPFHYGRWAQLGPRWVWVPGPKAPRPTYAPALVGFIGSQPGSSNWHLQAGPGIGWFPLAPGEAWRPGYRASPRYLGNINRDGGRQDDRSRPYFFQGRPNAVTAVPQAEFGHGPAWRQNRPGLREADLAHAQVLSAPPMPQVRQVPQASQAPQVPQVRPGTRPDFDRSQRNDAARSQAEQAQRAQVQAEEARQRQQDALQRPNLERQAQQVQQERLQREMQLQQHQQLQQRQQLEQQQRQQQQQQQQRVQPNQIDPPGARPQLQQSDLLRREQQAQQERQQRETAQREQLQRQQQLQQREQQNQQAEQLRREQQTQQERQQRELAQREQLQRQQQQQQRVQPNQIDPPGANRQQPAAQADQQPRPKPRPNPQMLPGNNEQR